MINTKEFITDKIKSNFLSKVNKTNNCWEWTGCCNEKGYGLLQVNRIPEKAHRISFILFKGNIDKGLFVLHMCDNRKCVNPEHLYLGTHKDNMRDRMIRERTAGIKLHKEDVIKIKSSLKAGDKIVNIAKNFNVSASTIGDIKHSRRRQNIMEASE